MKNVKKVMAILIIVFSSIMLVGFAYLIFKIDKLSGYQQKQSVLFGLYLILNTTFAIISYPRKQRETDER